MPPNADGRGRLRRFLTQRLGPDDGRRAAISLLTGACVVAVTNALAIAVAVPWPRGGVILRAAHHLFDLAQTVGIGAILAAIVGLGAAFLPLPLWGLLAAYLALATAGMYAILEAELRRQAVVLLNGRVEHPLFEIYVFLCGLALPVAHLLGAFFARFRRLRAVPLVVTLIGVVINHAILRDDYPGVHGAIAVAAAILSGATLGPAVHERLARRTKPWARIGAAIAAAACATTAIVISPSNSVRLELFKEPGASAAWALARTVWSVPKVAGLTAPPSSPWLSDRAGQPPAPPSQPPLFAGPPVVVFITIDAVRADVIDDPKHERALPTIAQLKRTSAYFARATSPGSQTSVSLSTAFSGRYFSQLVWESYGQGISRFDYAARDPSPRFPELLTSRAVRTASFCSLNFLTGDYGVIRGFEEERMLASGRNHAPAKPVIDALLERLKRIGPSEPALLYAHLTEPHAPYDRGQPAKPSAPDAPGDAREGAPKASDWERYIAEIGVADAELARVIRQLGLKFPDRGVLIVSSDHGEAFGEHGTWNHTKTLYEELLRVPLIIRGPGVRARRIEQPVGLIDVGPTILDIFGVETPPGFMAQSLVPLLRGEDKPLDRPILAEGRLRRALYVGRFKIIEDSRRKVLEAYDLEADPGELKNLAGTSDERVGAALSALHAFFEAHTARVPGYSPPYKP
jgi:arylsulfatase A-like enzyme